RLAPESRLANTKARRDDNSICFQASAHCLKSSTPFCALSTFHCTALVGSAGGSDRLSLDACLYAALKTCIARLAETGPLSLVIRRWKSDPSRSGRDMGVQPRVHERRFANHRAKGGMVSFAQTGEHYNKSGTEALTARTRNAKSILVIGSRD